MQTNMSYSEILEPFEYSQVRALQIDDPWCKEVNKHTVHERDAVNGEVYHGVGGLLFERSANNFQDKLLLPHALRDHIIRRCHVIGTREHRDADDTYALLTKLFCFERMLQNTRRLVRECPVCAETTGVTQIAASRTENPPRPRPTGGSAAPRTATPPRPTGSSAAPRTASPPRPTRSNKSSKKGRGFFTNAYNRQASPKTTEQKTGRGGFRAKQRRDKDANEERWLNAPAGNFRADQKRKDDNNGNDFVRRTATKRKIENSSSKMTISFSNGIEIKIPA